MIKGKWVAAVALLVAFGTGSCFNEDGNCRGNPTIAETIDQVGVPNWRTMCANERWGLVGVVRKVPRDGRVLEIITCDTLLVQVRDRCFVVTQGYRSHSWSQASCPPVEKQKGP